MEIVSGVFVSPALKPAMGFSEVITFKTWLFRASNELSSGISGGSSLNTGRFANVSVRQRPVRQRMKSFRQRLMSVRQRLYVSSPTPKTPFFVENNCQLDNLHFTSWEGLLNRHICYWTFQCAPIPPQILLGFFIDSLLLVIFFCKLGDS